MLIIDILKQLLLNNMKRIKAFEENMTTQIGNINDKIIELEKKVSLLEKNPPPTNSISRKEYNIDN